MIDPRSAGFGRQAAAYELARPSYPAAALDLLSDSLRLEPGAAVVDLAAGTGKLTRVLAERFARVIAVEPSLAMLATLRAAQPRVEAISGAAESIPLEPGSVDAVFVAEAFHWFDAGAAIREVARVLRPGGGLALLWNREHWSAERNPWLPAFGELIAPLIRRGGEYPGERGAWDPRFEAIGGFEPVERAEIMHVHRLDAEAFVELISTWSFVANLDRAERRGKLEQVRELIGDRDAIELDYRTELIWTRKRADAAQPARKEAKSASKFG